MSEAKNERSNRSDVASSNCCRCRAFGSTLTLNWPSIFLAVK